GFGVRIKSVDGSVFSDNGKVVSASTLSALGTFAGIPGSAAVEPIPGTNTVYFLGAAGNDLQLLSFDRNTFLEFDSKLFTNVTSARMLSLVRAGHEPAGGDRLAFVQSGGRAGIISIPPAAFKVRNFLSNGSNSQLTWSSEIGRQYQVQWSIDLTNWTTFITTTATQVHTTNTFNSVRASGREFYRVVTN
ncbi:MAG: hypothetical protein KGS61_08665, partial [Verrucomicrobia bacterium]|nr:hypothetical protein [Verrucomicrobiota bacterium]